MLQSKLKPQFIYFGANLFEKFDAVALGKELFSFQTQDYRVFDSLNISSDAHLIDDVFLSWSYALFKIDREIYHCGFRKPECSKHVSKLFDTLKDDEVSVVSCGLGFSLFATERGHCYFFSSKNFQQELIDFGNCELKIKNVAVGDLHSLVLTEGGEVWILNLAEKISVQALHLHLPIKEVSCGKEHVLLLASSGQVLSYGLGSRGQLGHGGIENHEKPLLLDALDGIPITAIAAGGWHSAAISSTGDLYMWGWNESGQLGLPCNELQCDILPMEEIETVCCLPRNIEFENDVRVLHVSCGSRHTAALTEDNRVWTWGWNNYGQLGHNKSKIADKPQVVNLPDGFFPEKLKCIFWSTLITGYIKL